MDLFVNVAMLRAARYLWSEEVSGFGHRTEITGAAYPLPDLRLEPD